jgi:ribonuclease HI
LGIKFRKETITTFDKWFEEILEVATSGIEKKKLLTQITFLCWEIWKARCSHIYQGTQLFPMEVVHKATVSAAEFMAVVYPVSSCTTQPSSLTWKRPPAPFLKYNTDASWSSPSGRAGLGMIIRDSTGALIGGQAIPTLANSVIIAETDAVCKAMDLALELGHSSAIFESDCLGLINHLNCPSYASDWTILPLLREIRRKATSFSHIMWNWVPKEVNCAAHCAASLALQMVDLKRWASVPPPSLTGVLMNDGLPID